MHILQVNNNLYMKTFDPCKVSVLATKLFYASSYKCISNIMLMIQCPGKKYYLVRIGSRPTALVLGQFLYFILGLGPFNNT